MLMLTLAHNTILIPRILPNANTITNVPLISNLVLMLTAIPTFYSSNSILTLTHNPSLTPHILPNANADTLTSNLILALTILFPLSSAD